MSKKNNIIVAYLNNQECFLHHSGVIFIPKIKAIILSDIHIEKASALNIKKIRSITFPFIFHYIEPKTDQNAYQNLVCKRDCSLF